jgi:hypothetical protein
VNPKSSRLRWSLGTLVGLVLLIAIGTSLFIALLRLPPDPISNGRHLSEWFEGYSTNRNRASVEAAFLAAGTNAIPFLLAQIETQEPPIRRKYREHWAKIPSVLRSQFPKPLAEPTAAADALQLLSQQSDAMSPFLPMLRPFVRRVLDEIAKEKREDTRDKNIQPNSKTNNASMQYSSPRPQSTVVRRAIPREYLLRQIFALVMRARTDDPAWLRLSLETSRALTQTNGFSSYSSFSFLSSSNFYPMVSQMAPELVGELRHPNRVDRDRIAGALNRLVPDRPDLIPLIVQAYGGPRIENRSQFAFALSGATVELDRVIPVMANSLDVPYPAVMDTLKRIAVTNDLVVRELAASLDNGSPEHIANACQLLSELGPRAHAALPALEKAARGETPGNYFAARALWRLNRQTAPLLQVSRSRLQSTNADVLWGTARSLAELGPLATPVVPELVGVLDHPHERARARAAETLGEIGQLAQSAVARLEKAAQEETGMVRIAAAEALIKIRGQPK